MNVIKDRIAGRLKQLGEIGRKDDGLHCMALSSEENEAYGLTRTFMENAGLTVRVDNAGNMIGRREGTDPNAPAVMTGSHIDTVYGGGMFDGRLGVIAGIEAAQAMNEQNIRTRHPIEVCAYRDEEGTRFVGSQTFGSSQMTGCSANPGALECCDKEGITVREALKSCGLDPEKIKETMLPPGYAKAHVELHIEQGAVLENKNLAVGVVTGICCQIRGEFIIRGQAAHAGTTPIPLRKDALCAAAAIVLAVEDIAAKTEGLVATVGRITAFPGGVNVVPGEVRFSIDIRHLVPAVRDKAFEQICAKAKEICETRGLAQEVNVGTKQDIPMPCNDDITDMIAESCKELGLPVFKMPSGAGHDSTSFIPFCPSGMIFVRSKDGLSHNKDEYSSPEDCALGAEVLYQTLLKLAVVDNG